MKSRSTACRRPKSPITEPARARRYLAPLGLAVLSIWTVACAPKPQAVCGWKPEKEATTPRAKSAQEARARIEATLSDRLSFFSRTRGHRLGIPTSLKWVADGSALLFLRAKNANDPTQILFEFDVASGRARELVTPEALLSGGAETVSAEEKARRERLRIQARGIVSYDLSEDGRLVLVPLAGRIFVFDRSTGKSKQLPLPEGAFDPHLSPDGTQVAYVRNNNVYIASVDATSAKTAERALTQGGTEDVTLGKAEFVAQEELERTRGFWFSPDGTSLLYEEADLRTVEKVVVSDLARPEQEPMSSRYPRAGKPNAKTRFGIVPTKGGKTRWLDMPKGYEYVAQVSWQKGHTPTFTLVDRLQKKLSVWADGTTEPLATREDASWIDVDESSPRFTPEGALLWQSDVERLELRTKQGSRSVNPPDVRYQKLIGTSKDGTEVFFLGGKRPTASSVFVAKASSVTSVTDEAKNVTDAILSPDGRHIAVFTTGLDAWPSWSVRETTSRGEGTARVLPDVAQFPSKVPAVQLRELGVLHMKAALVWPQWIDPNREKAPLPVIDAAYGGPHVNLVTESALSFVRAQWMADATGAVVVTVDGRGTPRRGKDWEHAIAGHLGEVPLADHVAAIEALRKDLGVAGVTLHEKAGIFGWSFGGYLATMAAVRRPDVFGAAMAGAPVVDFRDYDSCYTERYIGTTDVTAAAYAEASVLTGLKEKESIAPLLVFHGTNDDNVYIAHTMKLVDVLVRAGHPFTFKPLPAMSHGVSDPELSARVWFDTARFFRSQLSRSGASAR